MSVKTRKVDTILYGENREVIFEKKNFEVPEGWSDQAALIIASKYATEDEYSAVQIIDRIVNSIANGGVKHNYFPAEEKEAFRIYLRNLLLNQKCAFNTPVWTNIGVEGVSQQSSACFLGTVEDTMDDILAHMHRAGMVFKSGSGIGVNISKLRAAGEGLSKRGTSSGPLSFARAWDKSAGAIKSAGRTRRSAVMLAMNIDHPDVEDFIECKSKEEKKIKDLVGLGYSLEEANQSADFQNANHSVVLTDEFMKRAKTNKTWSLYNRVGGKVAKKLKAKDLFRKIAQKAWETGDPGLQFSNTINVANPIPNEGAIETSNPCAEVYGVNWTCCLLVALNLIKYIRRIDNKQYVLDTIALEKDVEVLVVALDILIEISDYPHENFEKVARETRPIGIGITNLGAALMVSGIAYDSEEGREMAKFIYQNITSFAANASVKLAKKVGPFKVFPRNSKETIEAITNNCLPTDVKVIAKQIKINGIRNSQLTTAMPAGTVSLILDADTYGIEPLYSLHTTKTLVGGGKLDIIPKCVEITKAEGYPEDVICTAESVHWKDHIRMTAALQEGISGGLSKTINMPSSATVEDVEEAYLMAWEEGLKGITIYRDGSKSWQPLEAVGKEKKEEVKPDKVYLERRRLPDDRDSKTHHFDIGGFEGYLTIGLYPGTNIPGEIFIRASKLGSSMQGMLDSFATVVSLALQYGIPLEKLAEKFIGTSYTPNGITRNPDIRFCSSVTDYIFNYLKKNFLDKKEEIILTEENVIQSYDGPPCNTCGQITHKHGSCYFCTACGSTSSCS